ncbi:threonine dehydrogenase-like Zn-dependent dehydrogenase [Panacagrimonas perspica]|uniref:Threonine dehydrogenase-like Zn-dependent dehydrogenase n=1 Tax=Panacagrimonas perspica TaxID=381431 RepID=A0A4S3JYC0_9GAMM|nr:alcohol dehydrogenase catalytic domain-containing protein [Panacagrimonas perspica]TDU22445.1 threonine dehydrogenase-like Zn-dependent dehydrogenase [Panacagrimonas perspica]THD00565.1 alcohol dehydrogenase [Panacagrimonas perspica]
MKAAIYYGPADIRCSDIPDASIRNDHEMLVKVTATSICGSDLHLFRGSLDAMMERGTSQTGHELIGEVIDVGKAVSRFRRHDRVSMGYSVSCGHCYMCEVGQTAHCETTNKAVYGFGIPFGNTNGTHAEALVIPYADGHAMKIPSSIGDLDAITLSCNLPSAVIANRLTSIQSGERVAVIGCGPTGLMALEIALLKGPGVAVALDTVEYRLDVARHMGATGINTSIEGWKEAALAATGGRGFDKVIEVVGLGETLQMALELVRPGGTIGAIGVFCEPGFNLGLADVFLRNISLHMNGFANVQPSMWESLRLLETGIICPHDYFSHTFALKDINKAFELFAQKEDGAMKMCIRP